MKNKKLNKKELKELSNLFNEELYWADKLKDYEESKEYYKYRMDSLYAAILKKDNDICYFEELGNNEYNIFVGGKVWTLVPYEITSYYSHFNVSPSDRVYRKE